MKSSFLRNLRRFKMLLRRPRVRPFRKSLLYRLPSKFPCTLMEVRSHLDHHRSDHKRHRRQKTYPRRNLRVCHREMSRGEPIHGLCERFGKLSMFGVMPEWDVSCVTDMTDAFKYKTSFDGDLSKWDTKSVVDMSGMFSGAFKFNQDASPTGILRK